MNNSLGEKVALITGASSGIGRSIARRLSSMGLKLVLVARNQQRLDQLVDELGGDVVAISTDLAKADGIQGLARTAVEQFGSIDILVENAGIFDNRDFTEIEPENVKQMIDVNLTSLMLLAQAVLPQMSKQKSGDILVVGSIAGVTDMRNQAVYAATKHGVNAFIRSLRRQVQQDGIRVSSVLPGTVATELWGEIDAAAVDEQVSLGEVLRPEDVAEIVAFMLQQPAHVAIRELIVLPQRQDI